MSMILFVSLCCVFMSIWFSCPPYLQKRACLRLERKENWRKEECAWIVCGIYFRRWFKRIFVIWIWFWGSFVCQLFFFGKLELIFREIMSLQVVDDINVREKWDCVSRKFIADMTPKSIMCVFNIMWFGTLDCRFIKKAWCWTKILTQVGLQM